jgi:hypothetical protein
MARKIGFIAFVLTLVVVEGLKAQAKPVNPPTAFIGTWYTENSLSYGYYYFTVLEIGSDGSVLTYPRYNLIDYPSEYRYIPREWESSSISYATVTSASGSQITIAWNSTGHPNTLRLVGQSMVRSLVNILGERVEYRYTKGQPPARR